MDLHFFVINYGYALALFSIFFFPGTRSNLPRVSYVKAIDLWTAMCLMFVFAALLEFAYVNVTTRVEKRRMSMRDAVKLATAANRSNMLSNLRTMEEGKVSKIASLFSKGAIYKQLPMTENLR